MRMRNSRTILAICCILWLASVSEALAAKNDPSRKIQKMNELKIAAEDGRVPDVIRDLDSLYLAVTRTPKEPVRYSSPSGTTYEAVVWFRLKVDQEGRPSEVKAVWSSDNIEFLIPMLERSVSEAEFVPPIDSTTASSWRMYWVELMWPKPLDSLRTLPNRGAECDSLNILQPSSDEFIPQELWPELIREEPPAYPRLARRSGIAGKVWIRVLVSDLGNVCKAEIARSSGSVNLDDAALGAAYSCMYRPPFVNGSPVACWITYPVEFRLAQDTVLTAHKKSATIDSAGEASPAIPQDFPVDEYPVMIEDSQWGLQQMVKGLGKRGTVWVKALVGKDGSTRFACAGRSSGIAVLDDAAVTAAYSCRYEPAKTGGRPVACWVMYRVEFK